MLRLSVFRSGSTNVVTADFDAALRLAFGTNCRAGCTGSAATTSSRFTGVGTTGRGLLEPLPVEGFGVTLVGRLVRCTSGRFVLARAAQAAFAAPVGVGARSVRGVGGL